MARVHFFEWEDQKWFPHLFRNFITDHLVFHSTRLYQPVIQKLLDAMRITGYRSIVDLCSGGGGPLPKLIANHKENLDQPITATLTDLYPNLDAFERNHDLSDGAIKYLEKSTSAMDCPAELNGFRTIFTALHHFKPDDAKRILSDAMEKNVPIAAFEHTERSAVNIAAMPFAGFLGGLVLTPFVGKMTFSRFLFTYIIPLAPFFLMWDGIVSCLRTYTVKELEKLTEDLNKNGYRWEIGKISAVGHMGPYNVTYAIGFPGEEKSSTN
ncbi:hypothetical protein [Aliikangiella maris]|uniref:Uncharacterized protein n=2 Tax=Aliikangiella maris TaxID=3162458 RepID=A0ABV2BUT0_9GAMM